MPMTQPPTTPTSSTTHHSSSRRAKQRRSERVEEILTRCSDSRRPDRDSRLRLRLDPGTRRTRSGCQYDVGEGDIFFLLARSLEPSRPLTRAHSGRRHGVAALGPSNSGFGRREAEQAFACGQRSRRPRVRDGNALNLITAAATHVLFSLHFFIPSTSRLADCS
jgi:hypothetical protein